MYRPIICLLNHTANLHGWSHPAEHLDGTLAGVLSDGQLQEEERQAGNQ